MAVYLCFRHFDECQ